MVSLGVPVAGGVDGSVDHGRVSVDMSWDTGVEHVSAASFVGRVATSLRRGAERFTDTEAAHARCPHPGPGGQTTSRRPYRSCRCRAEHQWADSRRPVLGSAVTNGASVTATITYTNGDTQNVTVTRCRRYRPIGAGEWVAVVGQGELGHCRSQYHLPPDRYRKHRRHLYVPVATVDRDRYDVYGVCWSRA